MNRDPAGLNGASAPEPVDLAREAPFTLAHVVVTPAARLVEAAAWSQRLEPRAMQVLVVLARASPAVVGRGELNLRVWGGRVVGEDAINRAVQLLRRVAADAPPPVPFRIDTIPRVGYRLTRAGGATPARSADGGPEEPMPATARPDMRRAAAVAVVMLGMLVAALAWRGPASRVATPVPWRIASAVMLDDLPPGSRDVALSPDGHRLAYRGQDLQGRTRIFVRAADIDGAGTAVSPPGFDARRPAWSPNGTDLAFSAYDAGRPCRLYVLRPTRPATPVASCETEREPRIAWSADGGSLLFGDKPGQNAILRIRAIRLADGRRDVLSSPPGDSVGDDLPLQVGSNIIFRRQYGWADEGWVARSVRTGSERLLWRRRGVTGSLAAALPDGTLAIAWSRAGASRLDLVHVVGRVSSPAVALGPVAAISAAGTRLLVETDRSESALLRADGSASPLVAMHGQISSPVLLPDDRLRFPVSAGGEARVWERDKAGSVRPWGRFAATTIAGLALSPNGRLTAALAIGESGSEVVLFDPDGTPRFRWNPHARKLNPAAWSGDGRHLVVPVLDNAGWRLFALDPFAGRQPHDLDLPGFAVVQSRGSALYAVRAGETTGTRELWRLDGPARRLPFDLTLFDIVNWCVVDQGVWVPDRHDRDRPRLVLRDPTTGGILRSVAAPGLAGAGSRLTAGTGGPIYVHTASDAPEHTLLTLAKTDGDDSGKVARR